MSKRKITDLVTKIPGEIKRTPQPGGSISKRQNKQKYFQPNYLEVLKIITPNVYWEDDIALSGTETSPLDELVQSNILAATLGGVVNASSLANVDYLHNLNTIQGISQFFIKQNNLTWITTQDFDNKILYPLGKSFDDFNSSADFLSYISGTLLPSIVLADADDQAGYGPQGAFNTVTDLADKTNYAFAPDASGTHKYLIDTLSWMYLFNRTDPAAIGTLGINPIPENYATSNEVAQLLTEKLWNNKVITLEDSMKLLQKFLWSNYEYFSLFDKRTVPEKYRPFCMDAPCNASWNFAEYTSGTQLRDRLEILAGVVYSDNYFNDKDTFVKDAFTDFLDVLGENLPPVGIYSNLGAYNQGTHPEAIAAATRTFRVEKEGAGPFTRFMKGLSFSLADRSGEAKEIGTLVDIDECPDQFLPYLADLLGWTLIGPDPTRHRNQLRQAVSVYKAKGTKKSIQTVVDTVFGSPSAFNVTSGSLFELWESYIPNLMFYSLITSSILTEKGVESFPKDMADKLGLDIYSQNLDTLCKIAVDRIMWELVNEFPNCFLFGGKPFPRPMFFLSTEPDKEWTGTWFQHTDGKYYTGLEYNVAVSVRLIIKFNPNFLFYYRGREMPIPPWEEIKYYKDSTVTPALIQSIKTKLSCFGVDSDYLDALTCYIETYTTGFEGARPSILSASSVEPYPQDLYFSTNSFLFFTVNEKSAPNYNQIIRSLRPVGSELIKYLPYWSGKSSHFKIILGASSFDFTSRNLDASSKYALTNIGTLVDYVAPAHAIPDISLHVSSVTDPAINLSSTECPQIEMGMSGIVSSTSAAIIAGYAVSTVNPRVALTGPVISKWPGGKVFKRNQTTSLSAPLFGSGLSATDNFFSGAPRNILRRRSYKDLIDGNTLDLRDGIGAAGYDFAWKPTQLPLFYSSVGGFDGARLLTSGVFSLGFDPATLSFTPVALLHDPGGFGYLIDRLNLNAVWKSCEGYNSSGIFKGIESSSTFPFRGLSSVDSSTCSGFFGVRDSLTDILALQHRVKYKEKHYEASSLVSGYYNSKGLVVSSWPVSSTKLDPPTFSSWYEDTSKNVVQSMANQLEEATSATTDINYFRDFSYGLPIQKFFREWLTNYGMQNLNFEYEYDYGPLKGPIIGPALGQVADNNPHIFSHTYGPYFFNSNFYLTASSVAETAGNRLVTSSLALPNSLVDISYGFGQGPLSVNNMFGLTVKNGGIEEIPITASDSMYVQFPEVRSNTLLSGVQFVDTSTSPGAIDPGAIVEQEIPHNPTFALIKVSKINKNFVETPQTPFWAKSRTLEDNLVIQHTKPALESFPRLRYVLDPTQPRKDLENFLVPDCSYEFSVNAANFTRRGGQVGGDTLGVWIHTEPVEYRTRKADQTYSIEKCVWSFVNNQWVRTPLTSIVGGQGMSVVRSLSLNSKFPSKSIGELLLTTSSAVGGGEYLLNSNVITPFNDMSPRVACVESTSGPNDLNVVSDLMFDTLTFNFNTFNRGVTEHPRGGGLLHLKSRKYYIEIFMLQTDVGDENDKITLFDRVEMKNLTFEDSASIATPYAQYYLNRYELKTVFDHFRDLTKNVTTTRVASAATGHLEVSGGGRMSYRQNVGGAAGYNVAVRSHPGYNSFMQVSSLIVLG